MSGPRTRRILHYRLAEELGRDRVGAVFHALDEQLDRPVVVKAIRAADLAAPEAVDTLRDAFRRAAQAVARVGHPNFTTIYAFESVGAVDLIVMEHVKGESLLERVRNGERWRATDAAKLTGRIADALAAAHARGIAHGHLSLANVKLRRDGTLKILDLGVPKATASPHAQAAPVLPVGNLESFRADVKAMARMTCELIAGAVPLEADVAGLPLDDGARALVDAVRVWQTYGVLAPVLGRALGVQGPPFDDAAAFRDALLSPLHSRRWAAPEPTADAEDDPRVNDEEADAVLGPLHEPGPRRHWELALPDDLARRTVTPQERAMPVLVPRGALGRVRDAADEAVARATSGHRPVVLAATIGVLLLAGALAAARQFLSSGGATAQDVVLQQEPPVATTPLPPLDTAAPEDEAAGSVAINEPPAEPAQVSTPPPPPRRPEPRSARVTARPAGTTIRVESQPDAVWSDAADLTVSGGDSLVVAFSRPGYVTQRRVFRGAPFSVQLAPDSVTAVFESNVPAQVLVQQGNGLRPLGVTPLTTRLPSGQHRFTFRAAEQDDWTMTRDMSTPGEQHRIMKMDFPTRGGLVVSIQGGWAYISLNGGADQESPHRFENLPAGRHILRITRPGYQTIIDTVNVRPGNVINQSYTLRPGG